MKMKLLIPFVFYLPLVSGLFFLFSTAKFAGFLESVYSTGIYYRTIRPYSLLTGKLPFSLAEILVICLAVLLVYALVGAVVALVRKPGVFLKGLPAKGLKLAHLLVAVYLLFNLVWGINYNRLTFAEISGLPVEPASVHELAGLARQLTFMANNLRSMVSEDERGITTLPAGVRDMLGRAHLGFEEAARIYPQLGGRYGYPKGVMLSRYWSYAGITGFYFPFTAEANVNVDIPHFMLPSVTAHEMAHQRGFAREDEANYIAYLTCLLHPDPDFKYSGVMLALMYTMEQLHRYHSETWREVRNEFSAGVRRDLGEWREYWERYQGTLNRVSANINNVYLKANRQQDGVYSYGRMVDLLLAEFRMDQGVPGAHQGW